MQNVGRYFMPKLGIMFLSLLFMSSCSKKLTKTIIIDRDKDLIPEGIAVAVNKIFISSIHKNKIIEFDINRSISSDFIKSDSFNFKSGVGLFAKKNILYALTNDLYSEPNLSSVFLFDIKKKTLIKKYQLSDSQNHFFNDLTIDEYNQLFITDSKQHKVFTLDPSKETFSEFLSDSTLLYPNGITISDDNKILFVASALNGLRILNIDTKKYLNAYSFETMGIDGMKYHNHCIYAIKNDKKTIKSMA